MISPLHLKRYPLCGDRPPSAPQTTDSDCQQAGRVEPAVAVDHIIPHRGNRDLFLAESNRQSLCALCHGRKSQGERR